MNRLKPIGFILIYFLLLTALLHPWRDSVSQDDAPYSYSAVSMAFGEGELHVGNVAMIFPQLALGTAAIQLLPTLPHLSVLNFLTWLCFLTMILLTYKTIQPPPIFLLSFFSFPIWIQYASSYLSEIYSALCLALLLFITARRRDFKNPVLKNILIFIFATLLGTQIQNMAAFPFFWGAFIFSRKEKQEKWAGALLMMGALLSVLLFLGMKKTPFQQGYGYWMLRHWLDLGTWAIAQYALHTIQILLALGLYLLPTISPKLITRFECRVGLLFQIWFLITYQVLNQNALSTGVFFTSYLPNVIGLVFISTGIWGWIGVIQAVRFQKSDDNTVPWRGTLCAMTAILAFSTFRMAIDLRYAMTWAIPVLFHIRHALRENDAFIGRKAWFFASSTVMALLLNRYSLNTTEARWAVAAELETKGTPVHQIAAGVGHDSYKLEHECVKRVIEKLRQTEPEPIWKSRAFFDRIINMYSRSHSDGWVPKYIIKPSQMLGKSIALKNNRLPGQDQDPVAFHDYSVFGIPNQLAIFENKAPHPAWCDQ